MDLTNLIIVLAWTLAVDLRLHKMDLSSRKQDDTHCCQVLRKNEKAKKRHVDNK